MRTIIFLLVLILINGCCTQKRCLTKYPPQTIIERSDSTIYRDTIIYHDRIVYDTIRADTVFIEKRIKVPSEFKTDPIEAENTYAIARAWIENQKLKLELTQKDQVIQRIIKNAEVQEKYWREQFYKEVTKETTTEYKTKRIHKIAMWLSGIVVLVLVLYIIRKFFL